MKTKYLTALIVDQDPTQGRAMAALVKELFNKIHLGLLEEDILRECASINPKVIFFNLGVDQRTANFEILEKLPLLKENQTIIFGYLDGSEPELVAHAIEIGFHDIFVRPFDADLFASKINKFFQFDKTQDRDINYKPLKPQLGATLKLSLKLIVVDENGLTFRSEHFVNKGTHFQISSPLIKEIFETSAIDLMVSKSWLGENYSEHFFFAEPTHNQEKYNSALRRFILSKL